MAHRVEQPTQKAMLTKRVGTITAELTALNKAGKAASKEFHTKLDRLHKYQRALRGPRKVEPIDYAAYREKAKKTAKMGMGTRAVSVLMKSGLKGPLSGVLQKAKAGAEKAQSQTKATTKKSGVSRKAYDKHLGGK